MTYGLQIKNPSGDLVISSQGMGLSCVGKAQLYGAIVQPTGNPVGPWPGKRSGYSVYRVAHAGPVIWALDLPIGKRVSILSSTEVSSGLWEVTCYCGSSLSNYQFDDLQTEVAVWAFGVPNKPLGPLRAHIYNAAGGVAYDLTEPNMLFPRIVGESNINVLVDLPPVSRPVILGFPTSDPSYSTSQGTNRWASEFYRGGWERFSSTQAREAMPAMQRWEYSATEPVDVTGGFISPTTYIIMEGAYLPT